MLLLAHRDTDCVRAPVISVRRAQKARLLVQSCGISDSEEEEAPTPTASTLTAIWNPGHAMGPTSTGVVTKKNIKRPEAVAVLLQRRTIPVPMHSAHTERRPTSDGTTLWAYGRACTLPPTDASQAALPSLPSAPLAPWPSLPPMPSCPSHRSRHTP